MPIDPLHDIPQQEKEKQVESPERQSNMLKKRVDRLTRLGLGETAIRVGTNVMAFLLVLTVVCLLQKVNLGTTTGVQAATNLTPVPTLAISQLPVESLPTLEGITRYADLHTIIPSRPRIDVIQYTVLQGDSIFKIADNFGLQPSTILFGNWNTLQDHPNLLKPGQELNILPVDGAYYEWQGVEDLKQVASTYSTDVDSIINYPGNHLDADTLGDLSNPNIPAGSWLIIPGGKRPFTSWTAPAQLVRSNPSTGVWGPGVCTGISYVQVGYGTFVFPTTEHWLSGTDYRPDLNHYGVDFAGSEGNAVYAVDAGTVVYSGWNTWGYGNLVIIDHGNGWQSLYAHLSAILVSCGQNVGQGDMIGLVGMTGGTSTGPHLHFEISYNGAHVDPHTIFDIP
jgi:murein DD-endopeptidase MepM/ murein hydrolase activator NlpD